MQEGECSVTYLREMAIRCRQLADQIEDERHGASMRNLAGEYEKAAEAQNERNGLPRPMAISMRGRACIILGVALASWTIVLWVIEVGQTWFLRV